MTTTYKLKTPVTLAGVEIKEITLTPKAVAFKGFKQKVYPDGSVEFDNYAAAACAVRMSGHPDALLENLHPTDMTELSTLAMSFFVNGQATGTTP